MATTSKTSKAKIRKALGRPLAWNGQVAQSLATVGAKDVELAMQFWAQNAGPGWKSLLNAKETEK